MPVPFSKIIRNFPGFYLGIVVFVFFMWLLPSETMPGNTRHMAAVAALMAVWWITEAIPIPATALLPIVLYPLLKIMPAAKVTVNYGHHLVFLFLGGFIIALTIERWQLHRRIALLIINLIGINPRMIVLGFMIATAFLSMWISNTATTMMMIPIAMAVILQFTDALQNDKFSRGKNNFALALMLAIAYSASIGGIATLIGTPPNLVFIGILKANFPGAPEISFVQWMLFALPFSVIFLPLAWFYLVYIAAPVKIEVTPEKLNLLRDEYKNLGPMSRPELYSLVIFIITAFLWMFRTDIDLGAVKITGWATFLGVGGFVTDSTVAVAMALITFMIPVEKDDKGKPKFLMDWTCAARIPWGILLLFGGGFAIAAGFQESGLTRWLGEQLSAFRFLPLVLIIIIVCTMTTLTTEFASNTAMATTILPIIAGLGVAIGLNPMILMIPATISSSTAFMLPVATPPNAIVFGTGHIQIRDMVRVGLVMNLIGLVLIVALVYLSAESVFQFQLDSVPSWAK